MHVVVGYPRWILVKYDKVLVKYDKVCPSLSGAKLIFSLFFLSVSSPQHSTTRVLSHNLIKFTMIVKKGQSINNSSGLKNFVC